MSRMCGFLILLGLAVPGRGDEKPQPEKVKLPGVLVELKTRTQVDQEARQALVEFMAGNSAQGGLDLGKMDAAKKKQFEEISKKLKTIDQDNTRWLTQVVDKHGWLGVSQVGKEGAGLAWLLVQHADLDPKFQRRCLDLMTALPKEEVSQKNLAYLTDRVLLAEGKKQKYGTQFTSQGGEMKPSPIEDEAKVDERRKEMGLPPLAEYAEILRKQYGGKAGK